jgi:hypothetical protein
MRKLTAACLLRSMALHSTMGACLGLLTFWILIETNNGNVSAMIAAGSEPTQTVVMLAAVFAVMFALPCGLTGMLFIAIEAGQN